MVPKLETDRLQLRSIHKDDGDLLYTLSSNPEVLKYINGGRVFTRNMAAADLEKRLNATTDVFGYWMVHTKEESKFVGWGALKTLDQSTEVELGYRLLQEHWGKGYATEIGQRLLVYGFKNLNLPKVVAVVKEQNFKSRRVLEKLGFIFRKQGQYYGTTCLYYDLYQESMKEEI